MPELLPKTGPSRGTIVAERAGRRVKAGSPSVDPATVRNPDVRFMAVPPLLNVVADLTNHYTPESLPNTAPSGS
jgi:hypothetical protein